MLPDTLRKHSLSAMQSDLKNTLNVVLGGSTTTIPRKEIHSLLDTQFQDRENKKETAEIPVWDKSALVLNENLKNRAERIFNKVIQTPVIQKCLPNFDFKVSVLSNPEFDAYEDNAQLDQKKHIRA